MRVILFILLCLANSIVYAQDDDINRSPMGFGKFAVEAYTVERAQIDDISWTVIDSNYRVTNGDAPISFAHKVSADSFEVIDNIGDYNKVLAIDTIAYQHDTCLAIYGSLWLYGSGGGTTTDGITIISLEDHTILLIAITSVADETFERPGIKGEYEMCYQAVKTKKDRIVVANIRHSKNRHTQYGACGLTELPAGTFLFRQGKFTKQVTSAAKKKKQ